jgi:hypothetical protein
LVRLIRSKGVGVYFVTQNPLDVPDTVLGQLGNRVQHALRAFTPRDQKAVKATAQTMRAKPGLNIEATITELGVGEALVSLLDTKGTPCVTERVYIVPPGSQLGPIDESQRQALLANSIVAGVYEKAVDRESAFELLKGKHAADEAADGASGSAAGGAKSPAGVGATSRGSAGALKTASEGGDEGLMGVMKDVLFGTTGPRGAKRDGLAQTVVKSAVRTIGTQVGREIMRGILGSVVGKSGRR